MSLYRLDTRGTAIFILLSIKTRIETDWLERFSGLEKVFLSYYPLKQGLKLLILMMEISCIFIFILLSIKTRIET